MLVDSLPILDDSLVSVILLLPFKHWQPLTLVSKQFYRCINKAKRQIRTVNMYDMFPEIHQKNWIDPDIVEFKTDSQRRMTKILTYLSDRFPSLTDLSGFDCVTDQLTGEHFEILNRINRLNRIAFERCRFDADDFAGFLSISKNLRDLTIRLCLCDFDGTDVAVALGNVSNSLEILEISSNEFSNSFVFEIPQGMFDFVNGENLKFLTIKARFQYADVIQLVGRCPNLEKLALMFQAEFMGHETFPIPFDTSLLRVLSTLRNLQQLHLTILASPDLANLCTLTKLKRLKELRLFLLENGVGNEAISDYMNAFFHAIVDHPSLESLQCWPCCQPDLGRMSGLKSLKFNFYVARVDDSNVWRWLPKLVNLTTFHMEWLFIDAVDEASRLFDHFVTMKNLRDVRFVCNKVNDVVLKTWNDNGFVAQLVRFELKSSGITDEGVRWIASGGRSLKGLAVDSKAITVKSLDHIVQYCPCSMEELHIQTMFMENPNPLFLRLIEKCPKLNILGISSLAARLEFVSWKEFASYKSRVNVQRCFYRPIEQPDKENSVEFDNYENNIFNGFITQT